MELKRTINAFSKCGATAAALYPALAAVRLNLRLRLTPVLPSYQAGETTGPGGDEDDTPDLTADTEYVFQLQELLYSEAICLAAKLQLLLLLQENSHVLIRSQRGVAQLLSFLLDLVRSQQQQQQQQQQQSQQQLPLLSAQAMVCCCSLMIGRDLLRDEHQVCSKFVSHLLELAGSVNSIHNLLLRFRALQSLLALEDAYPCLLSKKLDYFYQFCTSEKTYLSEFYYMLFSQLLLHVFDACLKETGSWSDERLSTRVESLPAVSLSTLLPVRGRRPLTLAAQPKPDVAAPQSSPPAHPELSRALGRLVAALDGGRLSPRAFAAVCRAAASVLARGGGGGGGRSLRTAFYRRLAAWDASVLAALAGLRLRFGLEELGGADDANGDWLALSMQRVACSPLFPAPLRLLMCHCLAAYPHLRLCSGRDAFPQRASNQLVKALFPSVFDPIDLRVLKVNLLSLRFAPRDSSDEASACLMGTLVSLSRPALKSRGRGRPAAAFFASLYAVFSRHHASVLGEDIRQMLISMVNANLAFADHLLDFLDCVTLDFPDSELPFQAYSELCDWVAINSLENASDSESLSRYMTILNRAALYSRIPAPPIVEFLAQLAPARFAPDAVTAAAAAAAYDVEAAAAAADADWLCGHLVLDVCRSLFRTHARQLEAEPALLASLCGVIADFADDSGAAVPDVDVRSRAQLYYSLACHMSPTKLASLVFEATSSASSQEASPTQPPQLLNGQQPLMQSMTSITRTRTSIAVAAPPASQTMPELRTLTQSPIELATDGPVREDQRRGEVGEVLIVPVLLTCRRTPDLSDESALLAVDLTFEPVAEPADDAVWDPADDLAAAAGGPVVSVEPLHIPYLELPPLDAEPIRLSLSLRLEFRRPLPCRLAPRLDCTAAGACRPLTAWLPQLRLGLADLLLPLPLPPPPPPHPLESAGWCSLERPGASFIRVPTLSAAAAAPSRQELLARFQLAGDSDSVSYYAFRVAPDCQLRLAVPAVDQTSGGDLLLTFCVAADDSNGGAASALSRDARRLLMHFDRYLKVAFSASEANAVQL